MITGRRISCGELGIILVCNKEQGTKMSLYVNPTRKLFISQSLNDKTSFIILIFLQRIFQILYQVSFDSGYIQLIPDIRSGSRGRPGAGVLSHPPPPPPRYDDMRLSYTTGILPEKVCGLLVLKLTSGAPLLKETLNPPLYLSL